MASALARLLRSFLLIILGMLAVFYGICTLGLLLYTLILPPVTTVQMQRHAEAMLAGESYTLQYDPVPRSRISSHLAHAVIAAEDGRFYEHSGIDWEAVREAYEELQAGRRKRGGSTITQQLVKNLFLTTHSNYIRKGLEFPLTFIAELVLTKERILTLYLNVVELGRGVFGAEAAAQHFYSTSAADLSRWQSASLAACLPAPLNRHPQRMQQYTSTILGRMGQMGW